VEVSVAILNGILCAVGVYLLLDHNLFRILLGLALLAQAANLLVFSSAGLGDGSTPIIQKGAETLSEDGPDPLAQALVLTAIVIGFGVLAFCITLFKQTHRRSGESEVDALTLPR